MPKTQLSDCRIKQKRLLRWRRASSKRYPGQRYDAASGLNYNYFRDYEPETGRYNESDPVGQKGGFSTYSYSSQNPFYFSDPYGLWCVSLFDETTTWRVTSRSKNMGTIQASVLQGLTCIFHNAWFITEQRMKRSRSLCFECTDSNIQGGCGGMRTDCNFVVKNGAWAKEERFRAEARRDAALTTYANGRQCSTCRNPFTGVSVTACDGDVQGGDGAYQNPRNPLGH